MKLIRHNQKVKAKTIFDNAKNIKVYTLGNCFTGESANKLNYKGKNWLLKEWMDFDFARLMEGKPHQFQLRIHSNCWFEFEV